MVTASSATVRIALDAMGGDHAPASVIEGADAILSSYPQLSYRIFGDEKEIAPLLERFPEVKSRSVLVHTESKVLAEDKPSQALRQGKHSSMRLAIEAVERGDADAIVSSGNTGALMAMAKIVLRTLPGISRPAICTVVPTMRGRSVMLDLGANVECTPENLYQFAVMGNAFARVMLGLSSPSIGLLNIGSEDAKGNETVKAAAALFKSSSLASQFYGYIEGNNIAEGLVDIIVTDGFSGNIALKTAEGTAKICRNFTKEAFQSSLLAKIGFLFARRALATLFGKLDHRSYNGAMFVGLNGIVVKSHGGSDSVGFASALKVAAELAAQRVNEKIINEVTVPYPSV